MTEEKYFVVRGFLATGVTKGDAARKFQAVRRRGWYFLLWLMTREIDRKKWLEARHT